MLGVLRAGGVISDASLGYNVEKMTYALKTSDTKFLMTMPSYGEDGQIPALRIPAGKTNGDICGYLSF